MSEASQNTDKDPQFLEGLQHNFSILSFTETWLCDYNNTIHNFIGYSHLHKLTCKNKVSGGVSMFIHSKINFISREDIKRDLNLVDILAIENT